MRRDHRAVVSQRISAVLAAMNTTPPREMPALDICRSASLPSRSVNATLRRMVELGWAVGRWDGSAAQRAYARRQVYKLTPAGVRRAHELGERRPP
jgi:hypothetical protein